MIDILFLLDNNIIFYLFIIFFLLHFIAILLKKIYFSVQKIYTFSLKNKNKKCLHSTHTCTIPNLHVFIIYHYVLLILSTRWCEKAMGPSELGRQVYGLKVRTAGRFAG